jgi:tetratricopeptide (TPR) repeat protein
MADLQRWSAEVARDPAAPAFLPLAQAYRRQGRAEAALQLCIRALARDPAHLEGHALLAQLYLEAGDEERAGDEWSIVLRLDPDHFEAHRGLGFYWLERGRTGEARRHLEWAAAQRPQDAAVRGALALLEEGVTPAAPPAAPATAAPSAAVPPAGQAFGPLLEEPGCLGVLVLDREGLIRGGGLREGAAGQVETLAALVGGVLADASRLLDGLGSGACRGLVVETSSAVLQLLLLGDDLLLLLLGGPEVSPGEVSGWARRAAELGRQLQEAGA